MQLGVTDAQPFMSVTSLTPSVDIEYLYPDTEYQLTVRKRTCFFGIRLSCKWSELELLTLCRTSFLSNPKIVITFTMVATVIALMLPALHDVAQRGCAPARRHAASRSSHSSRAPPPLLSVRREYDFEPWSAEVDELPMSIEDRVASFDFIRSTDAQVDAETYVHSTPSCLPLGRC